MGFAKPRQKVLFVMDSWKNINHTTGKTISEVVNEIIKCLSKEKDALELCEKLKRLYKTPQYSVDFKWQSLPDDMIAVGHMGNAVCTFASKTDVELRDELIEFNVQSLFEKFNENGVTVEILWHLDNEMLQDIGLTSIEKLKYSKAKEKREEKRKRIMTRSPKQDDFSSTRQEENKNTQIRSHTVPEKTKIHNQEIDKQECFLRNRLRKVSLLAAMDPYRLDFYFANKHEDLQILTSYLRITSR